MTTPPPSAQQTEFNAVTGSIKVIDAETKKKRTLQKKIALAAGALVISIACGLFTFVIGAPSSMEANFAAGIPIKDAVREGNQVKATLTDESWLEKPLEARKEAMRGALGNLQKEGIDTFILVDIKNSMRGVISKPEGSPIEELFFL
jgi:hypothetical protein